MTTIRDEKPEDASVVRVVNELAFGQSTEADIVDRIRSACPESVSLVAEDAAIVGHILFSPAVVEDTAGPIVGMSLGPMAVLPNRQRQGIGSRLVRRGLEILRFRGCSFIAVMGHPAYYPRFGFEPASVHGLHSQWEGVPDEAFMVLFLDANAMRGVTGEVKYRTEFSDL